MLCVLSLFQHSEYARTRRATVRSARCLWPRSSVERLFSCRSCSPIEQACSPALLAASSQQPAASTSMLATQQASCGSSRAGRGSMRCAPPSSSQCSFAGKTVRVSAPRSAASRPGSKRLVVEARKLSHLRRKLWREAGPPPDLATRLFSERIVYLGMPIDSSVAELLTAQLFVLVQEAPEPIYFYINSTGIAKSNSKYGNEHEAVAVYSMMRGVEKFCPIYTLCVGNAFGEAALLLSAGSKGKRAALRSSTIMIRQPLQRLSGMQASDIDIYRRVTREKTHTMAKYLAATTGKDEETIMADFSRPKYFSPFEAADYGIIDQVLEPKSGTVVYKDWDRLGSEIGQLETFDDDEQPLPQNVMYPGTSDFWPSDGSN